MSLERFSKGMMVTCWTGVQSELELVVDQLCLVETYELGMERRPVLMDTCRLVIVFNLRTAQACMTRIGVLCAANIGLNVLTLRISGNKGLLACRPLPFDCSVAVISGAKIDRFILGQPTTTYGSPMSGSPYK